jgi:hypothetical protein
MLARGTGAGLPFLPGPELSALQPVIAPAVSFLSVTVSAAFKTGSHQILQDILLPSLAGPRQSRYRAGVFFELIIECVHENNLTVLGFEKCSGFIGHFPGRREFLLTSQPREWSMGVPPKKVLIMYHESGFANTQIIDLSGDEMFFSARATNPI